MKAAWLAWNIDFGSVPMVAPRLHNEDVDLRVLRQPFGVSACNHALRDMNTPCGKCKPRCATANDEIVDLDRAELLWSDDRHCAEKAGIREG